MKYLKKFNSIDEYTAFLESAEYVVPNVCQVGSGNIKYNPLPTPLYVEALEDLTVKFSTNAIKYSLDSDTWVDLPVNTATPTIASGTKVYFKANITSATSSGIGKFTISGNCNVGGNPKSLLYGDVATFKGDMIKYAFNKLFNKTKIIDASSLELTSISLNDYCYAYMFKGCTSLVNAPELPATTLSEGCYSFMFEGCTSLVNAPELPATSLKSKCYACMFSGCKSLTTAPILPSKIMRSYCYAGMFKNCTSLVNAPELSVTSLDNYCYGDDYTHGGMFEGCTSLVNAPELSVTSLKAGCYVRMFSGCTSLVNAPELPATTLVNMCYAGMFKGCTSLVNAPELPATTLANWCYGDNSTGGGMFENCSNLNYIKAMFTDTPSTTYTPKWVSGVSATGTFVKNAAATWDVTGVNGVPSGWTVETATK